MGRVVARGLPAGRAALASRRTHASTVHPFRAQPEQAIHDSLKAHGQQAIAADREQTAGARGLGARRQALRVRPQRGQNVLLGGRRVGRVPVE